MTTGQAFSIRLRNLLEERGISLHKFLKDNCIARSTIVNIERGNTKSPTLAIIYQVATGFGMDILEFFNDPIFKSKELEFL